MSSGGLSAHFQPDDTVPLDYLFTLSKVTFSAGCVNYFVFAFVLIHARIYQKEGWKNDSWFFRSLVSQLVILSVMSIALQSVGAHYVLKSLFDRQYLRETLDWIDVVQRLLCFPTGALANCFFTWRVFQVSDSRAVWITCLLLWIPGLAGFLAAEISHVMTLSSDFSYAKTWRISEVIGTVSIFSIDGFYAAVLCWRLYIRRRRQAKPDVDVISQYFVGTVKTSILTFAVQIGSLITVCFLKSPQIYIVYSFFLLILPNIWALSVIWAINQRVTIRRNLATVADDASLGKRLAVVGWRSTVAGLEEGSEAQENRNDPSKWRGDDQYSAVYDDQSSHRQIWKHKASEPDYGAFDLDTSPLDALQPAPQVRETQVSGIWVRTETKVERSMIV